MPEIIREQLEQEPENKEEPKKERTGYAIAKELFEKSEQIEKLINEGNNQKAKELFSDFVNLSAPVVEGRLKKFCLLIRENKIKSIPNPQHIDYSYLIEEAMQINYFYLSNFENFTRFLDKTRETMKRLYLEKKYRSQYYPALTSKIYWGASRRLMGEVEKQKTQKERYPKGRMPKELKNSIDTGSEPIEELYLKEFPSFEKITNGLKKEREKEIARLRYIEGMTEEKIGEMFGVTRQAISQKLVKIKKKMRENLKESGYEEFERTKL